MNDRVQGLAPGLLKQWRETNGLSQSEAAGRFMVTQTTVSDWESGKKVPQIVAAIRVERETGGFVPVPSWLGSEGTPPAEAEVQAAVATARAHVANAESAEVPKDAA